MTVKEMHYQFKLDFNKLDSNQNRDVFVPEIDVYLNRAQEIFIETVIFPRNTSLNIPGLENSQKNIDDVRSLVVSEEKLSVSSDKVTLPNKYKHYIRGRAKGVKGSCSSSEIVLHIRKHDMMFEENPNTSSSFEWRTLNGTFIEQGIKLYNKDFKVDEIYLTYLRKPKYIHNAEDFEPGGSYRNFSGELLTGTQDCELPENVHSTIVDIAVFLATGSINSPEYNVKKEKLNFNQTI